MLYEREVACRSCKSSDLETIIEFGETPLADRLLTKDQLENDNLFAPLTTVFCTDCSLVQILETVSPEVLFYAEYPYFSSVSKSLLEHFRGSALDIIKSRKIGPQSFVVEAASNDGYMLKNFTKRGISVLGIEPTEGPAQVAIDLGIETRKLFFTRELAKELRKEFPMGADVFLANNVLAHVPDLNGFVAGIHTILNDGGIAVIEAPYVVDLVDHCEFDTMYHQHLCYFSVSALNKLFRRHGLFLNKVERTGIHGGSLRLFVEPKDAVHRSVIQLLSLEQERKVDKIDYYHDFASRVGGIKVRLLDVLKKIKDGGKTIAGYGAAAKATTMMTYVGIDRNTLEFVADKNAFKQGKYFSGNHLHIVPPESLLDSNPHYVLILAWNFADEIMKEQDEYYSRGGRFIIPIPEPKIV